jgi:hypothetical protein
MCLVNLYINKLKKPFFKQGLLKGFKSAQQYNVLGGKMLPYSLSLWERVGVRVPRMPVIAGVCLILAFSQREKGQNKRYPNLS